MKVYLLQHEHDFGDEASDVKMIGVYATEADAVAAKGRLSNAPGFKDHGDGFSIDAYELGEDHWREGFRTEREPTPRIEEYAEKPVQARRSSAKAL